MRNFFWPLCGLLLAATVVLSLVWAMPGPPTDLQIISNPSLELVFTQQPGDIYLDESFTVTIKVRTKDSSQNRNLNPTIRLSLADNKSGITLIGPTAMQVQSGRAVFSGLKLSNLGKGYRLRASSSGMTAATSNPFNVVRAEVTSSNFHLAFIAQPKNGAVNHILPTIEVRMLDQNSNPFTIDRVRVDLLLENNASGGVLHGDMQQVPDPRNGGIATFSDLRINRPGSYTLTAVGKYGSGRNGEAIAAKKLTSIAFSVGGPSVVDSAEIDFDIVYVRYPRRGDEGDVIMPDGEGPYPIELGSDLLLLHPDGTEEVLVDCFTSETCSVVDPMISYDGQWVMYAKFLNADPNLKMRYQTGNAFIFKLHLATRREVQITGLGNGDADSGMFLDKYAGNDEKDRHYFRTRSGIRDLAPNWLPDGKIVFVSNRSAVVQADQGTFSLSDLEGSMVQQLHTVDDHDGFNLNRNLRLIGFSNLAHIQHPIVLKDGRLLFTNWDTAFLRGRYGSATLYTSNPDGTRLRTFFEPHNRNKRVDHWITELTSAQVVSASYYPSMASWGYGIFFRSPVYSQAKEFQIVSTIQDERRVFSRIGLVNMTPHTNNADMAATNSSGRYSQPAAAPDDALLFSYSPGPVIRNGLDLPRPHTPKIDAGIYYLKNAGATVIEDAQKIIGIKNTSFFNEMQPRPVVPYSRIFPDAPNGKPATRVSEDNGLGPTRSDLGQANLELAGYIGTSSLTNRESSSINGDGFNRVHKKDLGDLAWIVQGTDVGNVQPKDIYGVRIVAVVPNHYMEAYSRISEIEKTFNLIPNPRSERHVKGGYTHQSEKYKILGEWPIDIDGNNNTISGASDSINGVSVADTSFLAKVPANTTFFIQAIDAYGMTVVSEQTWRHLKPGEIRADCGGCHAHSDETPSISFIGKKANSPSYKPWDFTVNTPYIERDKTGSTRLKYRPEKLWTIEFLKDIRPLLKDRCFSCHTSTGDAPPVTTPETGSVNSRLSLMDSTLPCSNPENPDPNDLECYKYLVRPYRALARDSEAIFAYDDKGNHIGFPGGQKIFHFPNSSRYVRMLQARRSLLTWKIYDRRLDGWTNADFRKGKLEDLDHMPGSCLAPSLLTSTEKGLITRWIDLGAPLDFTYRNRQRITDDNLLPLLSTTLSEGDGKVKLHVLASDLESGVDFRSLEITLISRDGSSPIVMSNLELNATTGSGTFYLPLDTEMSTDIVVRVWDNAGNNEYHELSWP